ncbi:zinc ribbon domain-containing protein [Mycobacterium sp. Y57]|uniref:zinc ribbon domain-containing protein n=1 Tax=Mycolicibacterium xanthum TaxID=2796469 RepID=UPI001C84DFD3|nr:zinc ribbon domain-containing protein [Mycolicibacterium xanthum]MBX7432786.1 zinc ribbon domain-containing protein [Mycolicibacterium xanthum]
MSEHVCDQCGAENAPDAQFCATCDFYLGWDTAPAAQTDTGPTEPRSGEREGRTEKLQAVSPRPPTDPDATTNFRAARAAAPARASVPAPGVQVPAQEVALDPTTGTSCDIRIRNRSTIVDGYTVVATNPPPWLTISHPEIRLMTDREDVFPITLTVRPGPDVVAQRFLLRLQVCSVNDPTVRAGAQVGVVVQRVGGPVTLSAEPPFVRLRDTAKGRFTVRLDNSASNYPQRYALSATDPERIIRFGFHPGVVEVAAYRSAQASVEVDLTDVRPPSPGQQQNHTLTVAAAGDDGRVETVVNLLQQTSHAPPDEPVQLRLEPRVTRLTDQTGTKVSVVVDNRRGSKDRRVVFKGRDPEGLVRFGFSQPQLYVNAGEQTRVYAQVEAPLPEPGEAAERPFTVLCHDGTDESEAPGSLHMTASASPITTAQIDLTPEHVTVQDRRRGRMVVTVDNSRGALPLSVWLSGRDPKGEVRFTFTPAQLEVAPGGVGQAALRLEAPLPGSGEAVDREITVSADDGVGEVEAEARFSQTKSELLPILRIVFTFLGGLFAVWGAWRGRWFAELPKYFLDVLPGPDAVLRLPAGDTQSVLSQPVGRAVVLVLAGVMMLGILSAKGRITVLAGTAMFIAMGAYLLYAQYELSAEGPAFGAILVMIGAVAGVVGGLCIKRGGKA